MSGNWLGGKPTRNLDGKPDHKGAELEYIGKRAFAKVTARFDQPTVVGVMRRCHSMSRFPDWPALTAAFERLAACERGDELSLDAAFLGWNDEHAAEDAEASAVVDERAELRADMRQF